jgi:hypothetical protein
MIFRVLADAVVVLHALFLLFVILGGFLALRWPRVVWAHLPAALWGAAIEIGGWLCPLTPLEIALRERGGEEAYRGGFIAHYLIPVVYPPGLTRGVELLLAAGVIAINAPLYAALLRKRRRG